ncbi:hypothetical protein [Streptomyces sp. NPDC001530]|uniref:hypothetical protein n=1 Tax=Streptomyces sp. NPDC001530 TaxID=3364582 RepID=UPI003692263D
MSASPPPVLWDERLAAGIARLALRYRGRFEPETIQRLIIDSYDRLAEHARARVRTHVITMGCGGAPDPAGPPLWTGR